MESWLTDSGYSHSFALFELKQPVFFEQFTLGEAAVFIFFGISGFLVCESWKSDARFIAFFVKRALRIFPGLFVMLLLTTFLLGPIFTTISVREYFQSYLTWLYFPSNFIFMGRDSLPGLFVNNPFPNAVNGSLWTLGYEISLYICLASLAALTSVKSLRFVVIGSIIIFATIWLIWLPTKPSGDIFKIPFLWRYNLGLNSNFFKFGVFFFVGSALSIYRYRIPLNPIIAIALLICCSLSGKSVVLLPLLWLSIPYASIVVAFKLPQVFQVLTKGWDVSYGMYIYAFPIQQVVMMQTIRYGWSWQTALFVATITTGVAAMLSWFVVERPSLRLKKLLITRNSAAFLSPGHNSRI